MIDLDFTLEPDTHTYRRGDGSTVPSVTEILRPLSNFDMVPRDLLAEACERGSIVHEITAYDDLGTLIEDTIEPDFLPQTEAWRSWKRKTGAVPLILGGEALIEKPLIHAVYLYGCTPDGAYVIDGEIVVPEKKVTSRHSDVTGLQTSAQEAAINLLLATYSIEDLLRYNPSLRTLTRGTYKVKRRLAVRLRSNGKPDVVEHRDRTDFPSFLNFLGAHNWRIKHAKRI